MRAPWLGVWFVIVACHLSGTPPASAEVLRETLENGRLLLPVEPLSIGVAILPSCAPVGEPEAWADRLAAWGFPVLLFQGEDGPDTCEPETLGRELLDGFRRASMSLARRTGGLDLVALGWDTRSLIHAAASVFGGRDLFRAIMSLGPDVPAIGSPVPMLRAEAGGVLAVRQFLDAQQAALTLGSDAPDPAPGEWVERPGTPGPDLPPVGASLFDRLYSANGRHRIPVPFGALIADLNRRLGPEGSGREVLHALIPRGRSLQRNAAPGEEDRYPRVVLGIDRFPDESDGQPRHLLRDRLFVAYQESEAVLEIISFNADAGRFEFQVAHDYRPEAETKVVYAPRRLCLSCHQNGGPLFPEAPWDETADNPAVAKQIRAVRPDPYGLPVPVADNQALLIDTSTDRANLLPLHTLLWRKGCGLDAPNQIRCRAAAFLSMLQFRLSGRLDYDRSGVRYRRDYIPSVAESWRVHWPGGLNVPSADIPNRDLDRDGLAITPRLDPLRRRPPLATWNIDRGAASHAIRGLAGQLPGNGLEALDRYLRNDAAGGEAESIVWRAPCRVKERFARLGRPTTRVDCTSAELQIQGTFTEDASGRPLSGVIETLIVDGGARVGELEASARPAGDGYVLRSRASRYGVRPLPGHLLDGLWLVLSGDFPGARLHTVKDFAPVGAAIDRLARRPRDSNPFADPVFRPRTLLHALLSELGLQALAVAPASSEPASPRLEQVSITSVDQRLVPFVRHCAPCHAGPRSFPPPFLSGGPTVMAQSLNRCAPRILQRLSMWRINPGERIKTTMPPPATLSGGEGARVAAHLLGVLDAVASEIVVDPGERAESLPPCL